MKKTMFSLALMLTIQISFSQVDIKKEKEALKQIDLDFSHLSKEKGMKEAFLAYAAQDGVLLRPYNRPIEGFSAIKKFLDEGNTDFLLSWAPLYSAVSLSGELGYTYGLFELTFKDDKGILNTRNGTYVSIWKKDSEGKWKFSLDTGNPGLDAQDRK